MDNLNSAVNAPGSDPAKQAGAQLSSEQSPVAVRPRIALRRAAFAGAAIVATVVALLTITGIYMRSHAQQAPPRPLSFPYAFVESPNCDDRPAAAVVNCIVLHATVEPTTEGTMQIFLTPEKRVSAHFVVGQDGRVVQMVRVEKRAWHAGSSVLEGVGKVNDFSVGIEMVNLNDGQDPYSPEQLEAVAGIIRHIRTKYDVPDSRIVSHAQIALPAGRKSDPVGFDFDKIRTLARAVPPLVLPPLPPGTAPVPVPAQKPPVPPTGK